MFFHDRGRPNYPHLFPKDLKRFAVFTNNFLSMGKDGKLIATLTTFGEWKKETFGLVPTADFLDWSCYKPKQVTPSNFQDSAVAMAEDSWQEVKIVCKPGKNVQWLIDGKPAGELQTDTIRAVQLCGEVWSGTYVDDVELFYAGDAEALKKEHEEAFKEDLMKRQELWKKETEGGKK